MALLNFKGKGGTAASDLKERPRPSSGAHHFGIQVDDLVETQEADRGGRRPSSSSTSATSARGKLRAQVSRTRTA